MVHLLWFLLNLALGIGLVILFFDWLGFIKSRFGWFSAIFVGLISFHAISPQKEKVNQQTEIVIPGASQGQLTECPKATFEKALLDSNLMQNLILTYFTCLDEEGQRTYHVDPQYIDLHGFQLGFHWQTLDFLKLEDNPGFEESYKVMGNLEWRLLGMTLYVQKKEFLVKLS